MFTEKNSINISQHKTPFYFYDLGLLQKTLDVVKTESSKYNYHVHYAFKSNANPKIISAIKKSC